VSPSSVEVAGQGPRNQVQRYAAGARPQTVAELLAGSPFVGYGYAYPHKTAYRPLDPPRPLAELWADEPRDALFVYVHVPFCAVRCGFCNLFTQKHPPAELPRRWLDALARQVAAVRAAMPDARFVRWALGGGTPTLLDAGQLARLAELLRAGMGAQLDAVPGSVETSPETCTDDRLAVVEALGHPRISIGIQSFFADELRALGRPQAVDQGERALDRIRARRFGTLNIDLIYGIAGQTPASFVAAIDRARSWAPEQLYLYPLYQRPLTGLGRQDRSWDDHRLALYRAGRDHLLAAGYDQVSMRMFARPPSPAQASAATPAPRYCCQADGMVGLGVGARSYTRALHYSDDYAVGSAGIRGIVGAWVERSEAEFAAARYGVELDGDEQRRRYLIQSLLQREGLSHADYRARFGTAAGEDFGRELGELVDHELLADTGERLVPTLRGLEWADAIAPWFYSAAVRAASREFELR